MANKLKSRKFKCVLMCDSKVLTIGTINFVKIAGNKFGGTTAGRDDGSTWVVRFVDFG